MENKVKFVQIYDGNKYISIVNPDLALDELLEKFKEFCLGCGYHHSNVACIQYVEKKDD